MATSSDAILRTTISYPGAWKEAVDQAVKDRKVNLDPGARPNDIYREALREFLIQRGYLKDGE